MKEILRKLEVFGFWRLQFRDKFFSQIFGGWIRDSGNEEQQVAGRAIVGGRCTSVVWGEKDVLGQRGTTAREKPSVSHGQNYIFKLRCYNNGRFTRGKDIGGKERVNCL